MTIGEKIALAMTRELKKPKYKDILFDTDDEYLNVHKNILTFTVTGATLTFRFNDDLSVDFVSIDPDMGEYDIVENIAERYHIKDIWKKLDKLNIHFASILQLCNGIDFPMDKDDYFDSDIFPLVEKLQGHKYVTLDDNTLSNHLDESLNEKIEKHDTLNPVLFDKEGKVFSDVADKIEEIAFKFKDNLAEDGIKLDISDIYLLGSNASYNYTEDSDIDIHIIANERFDCDQKHLPIIYNAYKSLFNDKYDIKIKGIDVEVYVENKDTVDSVSNGIYSVLQDKWIKEPDPNLIPNITEKSPEFERHFKVWEDKYFDLLDSLDIDIEKIDNFIDSLYQMRQKSIQKDGEYGIGNLVFKEFRNLGYLDNLKDIKTKIEEKELSLTE